MAQLTRLDVIGTAHSRMGDEELVACARRGSRGAVEHLLVKYRNLVEGKASAYYLAGADHEDVVQEGMIGLFKAIRDFSAEHLCAFRSFAELCVTRQIISAVKTATRHKHGALNSYVSTDTPLRGDDEGCTLGDTIAAPEGSGASPEQALLGRELARELRRRIGADLSSLEARVLLLYLEGCEYRSIAAELGLNVKQVDNALQRAKKKLGRCAGETSTA